MQLLQKEANAAFCLPTTHVCTNLRVFRTVCTFGLESAYTACNGTLRYDPASISGRLNILKEAEAFGIRRTSISAHTPITPLGNFSEQCHADRPAHCLGSVIAGDTLRVMLLG